MVAAEVPTGENIVGGTATGKDGTAEPVGRASGSAADPADPGQTAPWDVSAAASEPAGSGGSGSGDSAMAGAARVFDVATTRRRPVIFEEDDDLDIPDFLK
jgi:cell division protein FtsZ